MNVEARLRAFAAVARQRSFSRAAQELYVSQPAVSKHVASLEAELGKQLVVRGRREATLTPAGELLADYVLRAEALLTNAGRALAAGEDGASGTLSLAASGIPGTYLLPELLGRFADEQPGVEIDFQLSTSGGALELVRAHTVELGVVGGFVVPPELESEPLVEDDVVLVGPASLGGRRLRARELEGLTWVSREEGSATRAAVEASRWAIGLHAVRTLELPSWEAVKRAVASGAGIAAISRLAIELEVEAGMLAVLDVPRWRLTRTISVVTARDVPLTPPATRFVDLLRSGFASGAELAPNSNLPALASPLVGRVAELDDLIRVVRGRDRLVTALGPGGTGKTRLALEAAARVVDDFRDGVFLVDLTPLRDPALVVPAIARVLSVPEGESLTERLTGRHVLLVLDNVEQVVEAAPHVAALVAAAPHLTVLATSRVALHVDGERILDVPPLNQDDAVALFVDRALAVDASFVDDRAVAELCRRLDGLPLAIELAAARVRAFPPADLLSRLGDALSLLVGGRRDAPSRQRTLRGAIAWSVELLDSEDQGLFARLGVFVGGCTPDAATAVCSATPAALGALVDASLLRATTEAGVQRYTMLETVREYAVELLAVSSDRGDVERRHVEWLIELALEAQSHARGPEEKPWLDRLARELDEIRAALGRSLEENGDRRLGLALAAGLEAFWTRRAIAREGVRWLEAFLPYRDAAPPGVAAAALASAARLALDLGESEQARPWATEAERIARAEGDDERLAWSLHSLGHAAMLEGDAAAARARFRESSELFAAIGMPAPAAGRLTYLADLERREGDLDAARSALERSIELYAAAGDRLGVAGSRHTIGDLALERGDDATARTLYGEALDEMVEAGSDFDLAYCFAGIAATAARAGRAVEAGRLWGVVERIEQELGRQLNDTERAFYVAVVGPAARADETAGRSLTTEQAVELARSV
jgi:predicted ATPase/DNA-binding transcriptional LysR family regulator